MIVTIASVSLPVEEQLSIKKSRFTPLDGDCGKRICIVTGIHGDELEGQYVCWEVARRIKEHPEHLHGTVDIYPAMNPMGIDSITRGIPGFDLDMNRTFPGNADGAMTEYLAQKIMEDLVGADLCLDIHSSNIYLTELPQIRINELHKEQLVPIAQRSNVDFIWVHGANTVLESTLAYSLNSRGTPTLVVEMGVGMRLTVAYGQQLSDGIFTLMKDMGIWSGETIQPRTPIISDDPEDVAYLNSPCSGIFLKKREHCAFVRKGEEIGSILNPFLGEEMERIFAPETGLLFTIREYPVVDEGSLLARIIKMEVPAE